MAVDKRKKSITKLFKKQNKTTRRKTVAYGLLAANVAVLVSVIVFVRANTSSGESRSNSAVAGAADESASPLDQLSSADIAVSVAHLTALPETRAVQNHADSFNAQLSTQSSDEAVIVKPQIITTSIKTKKDISKYTAVAGDTVTSVAQKFGITSDSIRWSNGITGDRLNAGQQLTVPPVSGIVYTVKQGDTVDSIAQKYSANKERLIGFNDAEIGGLKQGEQIVIPDGTQPVERVVASRSSGSGASATAFAWGGYTAVYSANGYDYGWCTWWAAKRRGDIGRPIPSNLGNAVTWASLARRAGLGVDGNPQSGDVAYYKSIGGLGHVGFVEQVNPDGSIWISDMNYFGVSEIGGSAKAGGWGRRSFHLVPPSDLGGFLFIH